MENFIYNIPAKVVLGEEQLPELVKKYGNKVLIFCDGGSIKKDKAKINVEYFFSRRQVWQSRQWKSWALRMARASP